MNRIIIPLLLFLIFLAPGGKAQPKGRSWSAAAGINLPFGHFSETHFPGAGTEVSFSKKRFGKLPESPAKSFSYLINAGADIYFGRKENISGYPFTYTGFFVIHAFGGLLYNWGKRINLNLAAGPALSVYNDKLRFNIGTNLSGTYYITGKIGVTPAIMFLKEPGADWLGVASIRGNWAF